MSPTQVGGAGDGRTEGGGAVDSFEGVVAQIGRLGALHADASAFGKLMNASHASLRDDYEVSSPALDTLARLLQADADVFGAKLTGAGFGGACVALCRDGGAGQVAQAVLAAYGRLGYQGRQLVPV